MLHRFIWYREGKLVITAVVDTIDRIENAVDIFMGLLKAFDSVSHNKLLESFHKYKNSKTKDSKYYMKLVFLIHV